VQLVGLLLFLLCGSPTTAQEPEQDRYPELRLVEQRIGELNRRLEVVTAANTPDDRLVRALRASLAVWQDWLSLLQEPKLNESPEARAAQLEQLRDRALATRLALSSTRSSPLPAWVENSPLENAQRRVASELRPAMTVTLQAADAANTAVRAPKNAAALCAKVSTILSVAEGTNPANSLLDSRVCANKATQAHARFLSCAPRHLSRVCSKPTCARRMSTIS
jgi:hypothetical protein